jgi:putrescine transport system ATP-binding protein
MGQNENQARPIVTIRDLRKYFGTHMAVDGLSLDIEEGEYFALLGASGCGKTTLLRMLAGLETASSGTIRIDGRDVSEIPAYRRPTNMVFQSYALFPHMTAAGNIAFGLKQDGLSKAEIARRVAEALALVDMTRFAEAKPHRLSGGQRQRIALARAVAKRPRILLLDEPMSALDKNLREATQQELRRLQKQLGITFIMVTHDQDEAMSLASRIGLMNRGRLEQVGTPADIYNRPCSTFSARFFGSVNLFVGQALESSQQGIRVRAQGVEPILIAAQANQVAPGSRVTLAVRPECLRIETAGRNVEGAGENRLFGRLISMSFLGDRTSYILLLPDGQEISVLCPNQNRQLSTHLPPGTDVEARFSAEDCIVLTE